MNLELRRVRLSLASMTLELDLVIRSRVAALFGPSGSGKTSILDLIAGLREPESAFICLEGRVLVDTSARFGVPSRARRIGYVPQDLALFPHLPVRRNVLFGEKGKEVGDPIFSLSHVADVLEIGPLLERGIGRLSGGEKQRVSLARALMSRPGLLLLDEPLAGLDESLKEKTVGLLRRVHAEFSVPMIYVSHAADEVAALCEEVVVLERGRVLRQGPPAEIFEISNLPTLRLKGERAWKPA
ncbi:MAG TPA: ATP-binding cassette domain-containing protein [Candidatus Polarisedimenticolia bacterium]|nr:ATP-binding cassette domain-containing protein [Candidatus Polarisedimenticolia bacterium]